MATTVYSYDDIKKAIEGKETTLIPGNKKTKLMLQVLSKVPSSIITAGYVSAAAIVAASSAAMGAVALTTGQVWALIGIGAVVMLIGVLRFQHCKIKFDQKNQTFSVEFDN